MEGKKNHHLLQLFKMVHNTVMEQLNQQAKQLSLTSTQMLVLGVLGECQGKRVCQKDLEKCLGLSNPTVTGILKRLESKDLIERKVWEEDARYKQIFLTQKSADLQADMEDTMVHVWENLLSCLTHQEVETLTMLLEKILNQNRRFCK